MRWDSHLRRGTNDLVCLLHESAKWLGHDIEKNTRNTPFAVSILLGEIKRDREDVYVGK
jgi:hypothetical protein